MSAKLTTCHLHMAIMQEQEYFKSADLRQVCVASHRLQYTCVSLIRRQHRVKQLILTLLSGNLSCYHKTEPADQGYDNWCILPGTFT